jgi:nucleoside-diphosphate-sugar epimerase
MRNILVTGANGFIGTALCNHLMNRGNQVIGVARRKRPEGQTVIMEDIAAFDGWQEVLGGIDAIVHLAGRAHILKDKADDPLEEFRRINTRATIKLAEAAVSAGVKRMVFISSIGVNGNVTHDKPFSVDDIPQPHTDYAHSKYEAELALHDIACRTGLEVTIIRPPLVYGPNAPGNYGSLMRWLASGRPLPLGSITMNRRSFVSLDNLVDLIEVCTNHPSAANQTFLVSDGEDLSTTDLLCRVSSAMGKTPKLFPVPPSLLRFFANAIGKRDVAQRLLDDLRLDIQHTRNKLAWKPPFSVDDSIKKSAINFHKH